MSNKDSYEAPDVVAMYAERSELQVPEQTVVELIHDRLPSMRMLDIGVGGGRTTCFFSPLVKRYVGIDYATAMIEACNSRFSSLPEKLEFKVCDVRQMDMFPDNSFDFILFSFNGLDQISHEDRLRALAEIRRIAARDALFCFSTHNLLSMMRIAEARGVGEAFRSREYAMVKDGALQSRLVNYYIRPSAQIRQLETSGFGNVRIFSLDAGQDITESAASDVVTDSWLYYLCDVNPPDESNPDGDQTRPRTNA